MEQLFQVLLKEKTEVVWQSEWFGNFSLGDVIELASHFTVAQFLAREDFSRRYEAGWPISVTELLYPLLQAYDSVAVRADVEFGGTDQKFNLLVGRDLQQMTGQRPQQCFLMPILPGTDGIQKMSKSLDNYIAITESPNDMFGKLMSLPDHLIVLYLELLADMDSEELRQVSQLLDSQSVNPMDLKKLLAGNVVTQFHSSAAAELALGHFERVVQRGEAPEGDMVNYSIKAGGSSSISLVGILVESGISSTRSEAKRFIRQGAVDIDGNTITSDEVSLETGMIIRVGKRRFIRIGDALETEHP